MTIDKSGCDLTLGQAVAVHLINYGVETPFNPNYQNWRAEGVDPVILAAHFSRVLYACGLNLEDPSLADTPDRVAKMYLEEVFRGLDYRNFPKCTVIPNTMKVDEMVLCKDISVWSICEHHLIPFTGYAYIGYIPKEKLLGLSKFNRIVDFFSRRPQVQERLTEQIYRALEFVLETEDVAVVVECIHHCVRLRGVKDVNSATVTSKMGGRFLSKPEARSEFLKLARG